MPNIRRTTQIPGKEDEIKMFNVPLSSRVVGEGVNNKTIYDLKKRGRAEVIFPSGKKIIFEVVDHVRL